MAAKTKARKSTKSKLQTWSVNIDGAITQVEAESLEPATGGLFFMVKDTIVQAVASGHWVTVELLEPNQD